ncbi:beta-ketoacyl-[acyl-carrier-protein] synthase family protein [Candidatus Sumerlaeota bacterium]|nr:beta-ketoacyl-[acyl-carrier-protein] synthase family protein [Candidatus Sumerlaeota bacterium]
MSRHRVAITGMGAISPYGHGVRALMDGLCAGRSAVASMAEQWLAAIPGMACLVGAPLAEPIDPKAIPRPLRRTMSPMAMMAYLASREAIETAGVTESDCGSGRMGVAFGSTTGSPSMIERAFSAYRDGKFSESLSSGLFFQIMSHTCAANVGHALGINGRAIAPSAACASSSQSIGLAFEMLQAGRQEMMLCGGAEELHAVVSGCFDLVQASSCRFNDRPSQTPRPFDRDRDGTVCGEGAGAVLLETLESAERRGARVLAELAGFEMHCGHSQMAQPRVDSIRECLRAALDGAGLAPDEIDYISAHATGTRTGDEAEAKAIREVFGAANPPVSSLKGHIGHTLAASGVLELIASIEMMRGGFLVPTLNLEEPDEKCAELAHVMRGIERRPIHAFVKNSFAFGGVNTVLVVKRAEDVGD